MELLQNLTEENKSRVAIIESSGKRFTYEQLTHDVIHFSKKIKAAEKQGILVLAQNNYQSIVRYLAALHNQDAVMLVNKDLERTLLRNVIDSYHPSIILGEFDHDDYQLIDDGIYKRIQSSSYEIYPDLAVLLSTSGTTGSVKFVRLSYKNIIANAKSIAEYLQLTTEERGLANLPIHYSYGLSVINSHLYAGATILLTKDSVLTKGYWEFIKNEKTTSFAGVPYTYQMLQRIGFQKMDLPHLRYFTQAGGRLNEKLVRLFGEYAKAQDKRFYVMYGQTEATARISYMPPEHLLEKPSSIGKAIPGGQLYVDAETEELIYEGPNVMLGYANDYRDLAKGDELQGRLHTGDLAEADNEEFFYIKGRMKRFLKLFGLRLNLDDIEKQLEATLLSNVVCVGTDDKMVVVIQDEQHKDKVQVLIEQLYKLHRSAFRIKIMDEIPRLANGKVNYEAVKDLVL